MSPAHCMERAAVSQLGMHVCRHQGLSADTLDALFERHEEHVERVWEAYPRFKPPEQFMPFELVKDSVYYVNAMERGARYVCV